MVFRICDGFQRAVRGIPGLNVEAAAPLLHHGVDDRPPAVNCICICICDGFQNQNFDSKLFKHLFTIANVINYGNFFNSKLFYHS